MSNNRIGMACSVPLRDQIAAVKREIAMRERVYPTQVVAGRRTQGAANDALAAMRAVLTTLESRDYNPCGQCGRIVVTMNRESHDGDV